MMTNTELIAEAREKGSAFKGWGCDGSASICEERVKLVDALADALEAATAAPSDTDRESLIAEARSVLTRAMNRSEDRAPGEDRSSWYAKALVDAGLLSRTPQPEPAPSDTDEPTEREKVLDEVLTNLADQGWDVAIADDPVKGVSIDIQPVPSDTDNLEARIAHRQTGIIMREFARRLAWWEGREGHKTVGIPWLRNHFRLLLDRYPLPEGDMYEPFVAQSVQVEVTDARELPEGSVFIGYYYPPTFDIVPKPRELASVQLTRGRSIVYGERMEYPLDQSWERIEVLYRPAALGGGE